MAVVSPSLIQRHISSSPVLHRAFHLLEEDEEVNELLKMSNVMAVTRLRYNDHGIVHARIVAGTSLEIFDMLVREGIHSTMLRDGTARNLEEAKVAILFAAYLHDIGNAVHRTLHEYVGALLAKDILDRLLPQVIEGPRKRVIAIRQEIMHMIFATEYNTKCLSTECGVVKISDGLDMSEGRARIPYRLGKMDMHAVSALSIRRVEIEKGERPVKITVFMDDMAGLFQVEQVLTPKILTSTIEDFIEVHIHTPQKTFRYYPK
ncbi:MAG: HD domain-containing protein [Crenarchaeota archaeon]|nr:HD domain-containing protein [Thermoproteota archaeon]